MNEYLSYIIIIVTIPRTQYSNILPPTSSMNSQLFFSKYRENGIHTTLMPDECLKDLLGGYIHYFYKMIL